MQTMEGTLTKDSWTPAGPNVKLLPSVALEVIIRMALPRGISSL